MDPDAKLRAPVASDAAAIWQLVSDEGGLDLNSPYAYLLLCTDFADAGLVAEDDEGLIGFVLGYRPPNRPDALFVWQIGVATRARRRGLARRLVHGLLDQPANHDARFVTATITPDNEGSMALFERIARDLDTDCLRQERFGAELFPGDGHEPELEFVVGPIARERRPAA